MSDLSDRAIQSKQLIEQKKKELAEKVKKV